MDRVLPDIKGNARRQRKGFSDDGKKRISIVISLDFTQDVSRIKHRKPGSKAASQESLFLMGFCFLSSDRHLQVDGRTIAAFRLQGRTPQKRFLNPTCLSMLFPDETWVQSKKLTIRILLFPSMKNHLPLAPYITCN